MSMMRSLMMANATRQNDCVKDILGREVVTTLADGAIVTIMQLVSGAVELKVTNADYTIEGNVVKAVKSGSANIGISNWYLTDGVSTNRLYLYLSSGVEYNSLTRTYIYNNTGSIGTMTKSQACVYVLGKANYGSSIAKISLNGYASANTYINVDLSITPVLYDIEGMIGADATMADVLQYFGVPSVDCLPYIRDYESGQYIAMGGKLYKK